MCSRQLIRCRSGQFQMKISGEETRLRYRYLDLRRGRPHANIMLRAKIIQSIRRRMIEQGFTRISNADPDSLIT